MATEIQTYNPIDGAIAQWLSTYKSERTVKAYRDTMADFRAALRDERGIDLEGNPVLVKLTAETWAASSRKGRPVAQATFNLRLAIISSFYEYYARSVDFPVNNPIRKIKRDKVQAYARAQPLDTKEVKQGLQAIDRSTLLGKRDYALLTILTITGRRLSEVARMKRGDLKFGETITVEFPECKGRKHMSDHLTAKQSAVLLEWLYAYYGSELASLPNEAPVWVSLSRRNPGAGLGIQAIADVCEKYLGTSKVHTLRHTFAVMMEQANAPISVIQNRLGHASAATTSIYLDRLHAAENPYAGTLDDMLGTGD